MSETSNSANGAMLSPTPTAIETFSGLFVDVANPDPSTLRLDDIAQGLALTCRYGGQIRRFYSVAEHAVLVHDLLRWQGADRALQLAGLFHDAPEAYLGDVVAPLKYGLRNGERWSTYDELTAAMERAIADRYDIDPLALGDERLRTADMWALRIEARNLTHTGGAHWRWVGELPNDGLVPSDVAWIGGLHWAPARAIWLSRIIRHGVTEPANG